MTSFDRTGLTHDAPIDAEIFTSDGDKIGVVREVQGGFFKVNAAMQPDYWLPMHCISSATGNRVLLDFPKDRLGDYKTDNPLAA
jgi:hypothetical protein